MQHKIFFVYSIMSNVTKSVKAKKTSLMSCDSSVAPVPKKRAPRDKKAPPTKEKFLKILPDASCELKQIITDLKEDEMKLLCMQLKRVPELVKETISNVQEDVKEIDEEYRELLRSAETRITIK